jgi:prepilin-type N-terminal cleavage/methylation domain-containing protein/prepilin-type processing-associated H-X9-DG protein
VREKEIFILPGENMLNQRSRIRTNGRGAFTLIELLVVIAIIAILAAILFPVFARARENARRASCQSQMKQIALGIHQYVQDYDEKYPMSDLGADTSYAAGGAYGWADALQPYLKSTQIYQCPSEVGRVAALPTGGGSANTGYTDYWGNYNLMPPSWSQPVSVAQLNYSANTVLNFESTGAEGTPTGCYAGVGYAYSARVVAQKQTTCYPAGSSLPEVRHLEGANFSFADGHVKWFKPGKVLPGDTGCNGGANSPTGSNATFCKD